MAGGYFKTNYKDDTAISAFDTNFRRFWLVLAVILGISLPFLLSGYYLYIVNLILIACMVSLSLNLVTGYTGLVSFGHAGLMCAGGLMAAIFGSQLGLPFILVVLIAILAGIFVGLLCGLPAMRMRGVYFVIGTVAVHFVVTFAATEYQFSSGFEAGIPVPAATLGPLELNTHLEWFYFLGIVLTIVTIFCINIVRSKIGRAFMAIRDRDIAAEALGVNVNRYKLVAFLISGGIAGLVGCLAVYYDGFFAVQTYTVWLAVLYLCMVIVGGLGSILGSFFGAILITLLPFLLDGAFDLLALSAVWMTYGYSIQVSLFGLVVVLFLIFEPLGLVGIWVRIRNFFELWPFRHVIAR